MTGPCSACPADARRGVRQAALPQRVAARVLLLLVLLAPGPVLPALGQEDQIAFNAALRAFEDGFAEKAAADLAELARKHPESPLLNQAAFLEARARFRIRQYDQAAEILARRLDSFGDLKPEALYLLAEIDLQRGRPLDAARAFQQINRESTNATLRLKAAFGQAFAHFRAGEFAQAARLLSVPTNDFVRAAAALPTDELTFRGRLLLVESLLKEGRPQDARQALDSITATNLPPATAWEKQWLEASLALTNRQTDAALVASSNLFALASAVPPAQAQGFKARSHAMRGEILRAAGRIGDAFASFTNNLSPETPAPWRREAFLAIAELPLHPSLLNPAITLLSAPASAPPGQPEAIAARIAVAELRLQQHFSAPAAATNALPHARSLLQTVISNTPPAPLLGRAWFNLAWTEVAAGKLPAATDAFTRAAELLAPSPLHALALFKLADCHQQAGRHAEAVTNYLRVIREYGGKPPVRGAVLERALYQGALAALESDQVEIANDLALRAVVEFPNGEFRDDTRVLYGQTFARLDPLTSPRDLLQNLGARLSSSQALPDLPEIRLAVARSLLRDGSWSNALHQLDDWTRSYPNHPGIARAEFERGWAAFKAGQPARAHTVFTNFLARFPDDPNAPQAQSWVGDYHFQQGNWVAAENSYQLVFQRTNWPISRLTHEARLMAGKAAFVRQGYKDAKAYFKWLIENGPPAGSNTSIPPDIVARAYFAYGDCFVQEPAEGDTQLTGAMAVFAALIDSFPGSREALLARGRLADCHLQRAASNPAEAPSALNNAAQNYQLVMQAADASVAVRSKAEVGLGQVLEKQAALANSGDRTARLQAALAHYLNVFHGGNLRGPEERVVPYWVHRSGLEAARLAESLGMRREAARLYEKLAATFPEAGKALRQRAAQLSGG